MDEANFTSCSMLGEAAKIIQDASVLKRILFAAALLPKDTPKLWDIIAKFAVLEAESAVLTPEQAMLIAENIIFTDEEVLKRDGTLLKELTFMPFAGRDHVGIVLISNRECCVACGSKLLLRADRPSKITLYTDRYGTLPAIHYPKYCTNKRHGCNIVQHYGYHTEGLSSTLHFDTNWEELTYFVSSQETAFEIQILSTYDVELLIGQLSYKQRAEIYNAVHGYEDVKKKCRKKTQNDSSEEKCHNDETQCDSSDEEYPILNRLKMDRRRLEAAHFKYAILKVMSLYQMQQSPLSITANIDDVTQWFYKAFMARYAEHHCSYPGCQLVLVIDGNQKIRRSICMATEAGFLEYPSLPGSIFIGCINSPAYKSRFCEKHYPRSCISQPKHLQESELGVSPCKDVDVHRSRQHSSSDGEQLVQLLLDKRVTRNLTYYKVQWLGSPKCRVSWEPASNLRRNIIDEYEWSAEVRVENEIVSGYGKKSHTATVVAIPGSASTPKSKKMKISSCLETATISDEPSEDQEVSCNTQKDKGGRLNHITSGILLAAHPCGIITLVSELFRSESKSQVYASLHQYFSDHPSVLEKLKYICYDDGCHLKKYTQKPHRSTATKTAERMAKLNIAIDNMHMRGHTDAWCKRSCDPKLFPELSNVNTEICEQTFSWLSRYKRITKHMSRTNFMFFVLYVCDLHNRREIKKLTNAKYL